MQIVHGQVQPLRSLQPPRAQHSHCAVALYACRFINAAVHTPRMLLHACGEGDIACSKCPHMQNN